MEIKDRIKQRRLELGKTMLDIAKHVGVSEATISRWESGDIANMRRDKIALLAEALDVSPDVIMGWNSPKENQFNRLRNDEKTLLSNYNMLNVPGKNEAQKRVAELTEIPRYTESENKRPDKEPDYDKIRKILMQDPSMADIITVAAKDGHGVEIRQPKDNRKKEDSNKED